MINGFRRISLFLLFLLPSLVAMSQTDEWEEMMQEIAEEQFSGEEEDEEVATLMEELLEWHENPLNINTATREDLLRFPFLSPKQAEAIINYRARHGALRTLGELALIPGLGPMQSRWLRQLVFVGEEPVKPTVKQPKRGFRHELTTRLDVPAYKREGWSWARGIAHRARYTLQWGRHWDAGLRVEKDAGEPMFTRRNPLWDAWGGHAMLKDVQIGQNISLQTAIVGDYKASFGEGLVMNTGFRFGKQQTNLWQQSSSIRPHRSAEESRYLRGVAATMKWGESWSLTALYSFRQLDATIQKDNTVKAINATGLHRTENEMSHRRTLASHTTALHADWQHGIWHAGATGQFQYYNHQFAQGAALYRQIYPEGYLFGAASVDYGVRLSHWAFRGETAYSFARKGGGLATLNKLTWRCNNDLQFSAVQRFYSMDYFSPHASAFGENTGVQNESGICLMADANRLGPLSLRALFDYFYSPWPRYTMSRYSTGFQGTLHTSWWLGNHKSLIVRYSVKSKERSDQRHYSHQLRAAYSQEFSQQWSASASTFLHHYKEPHTEVRSTGVALMPRVDFSLPQAGLRSSLTFVWFSTADYNSRLYLYEPSLMQSFGMQMLYGKGERLVATVRWQSKTESRAVRRLQLQFKAGVTHYRDRDAISSGPTLISSSWKPDFQLLFRYNLR